VAQPVVFQPAPRRFAADEVIRMLEAGILRADEPVELLEGELVVVPPQGPPHSATVAELDCRLQRIYGHGHHVRVQLPIAATDDSLPEPDVAVALGSPRDYAERHPRGMETILVIEIARTSQAFDRRKAPVYARAGVPTYWLIDLATRQLEVRSQPTTAGEYRQTSLLCEQDSVRLPVVDLEWPVASLFFP
jgi:Uma2 family endonuclease